LSIGIQSLVVNGVIGRKENFNSVKMRRRWIYSLIIISSLLILNNGCEKDNGDDQNEKEVYTTLDRTIVPEDVPSTSPALKASDVSSFSEFGYGIWHYGHGLTSEKRLDLMPAGYNSSANAAKLIRFFTITDIHITDKESPAQAIFFAPYAKQNGISCYAPVMLYSTHVLNATIQTINAIHKKSPIDFGMALGDMINNDQFNELRCFIDILDGKNINPDSGEDDDPVAGPDNDYQDKFKAEGLDKSIPWYAVLGNHDHFWMGSKPVNDRIRQALIGGNILQIGNIFTDPDALTKSTYSTGTLDGSTLYGNIIGSGVVSDTSKFPTVVADPDRRSLSTTEWMNEFSSTTSFPVGHGFIQSDDQNKFGACYSFKPKSDLPLKVIVLDDTEDESDVPGPSLIYGYGSLGNGRYEWLIQQLQTGQDEGMLMIIAAHVPIGVATGTPVGWYNSNDETAIIKKLKEYPNLILWISGHRHLNTVTALKSDDPSHPENGFWEVETKSLREFPQQFRTFDIVRNNDNTISIITTNVDPDVKDRSFATISRSYAIASNQIYGLTGTPLPTGSVSYNAELVKQLSTKMQVKIMNCGTLINK
jgi:metallophosphoesterase (TIGR03768 family)